MHHLELSELRQIDSAVLDLIAEARRFARGEAH